MSPYADELAHARLEALRQLIDAMREAEDPAEKRRCAVAIFNAPDPCDLDDEIELEDHDDDGDMDTVNPKSQTAPFVTEPIEAPSPSTSSIPRRPPSVPSVVFVPSVPSPSFSSLSSSDICPSPAIPIAGPSP